MRYSIIVNQSRQNGGKKESIQMKNMMKILLCLFAVLALSVSCLAEGLPGPDTSKKVKSIEVYQMPDKTVYVVNEEFSAEGGILKIIYTDGSEGYIAMTDPSVTLKAPKMNTVNTKNVQVKYGSGKLTFKVEVVAGMCNVSFIAEGAETQVQEVSKGGVASEPAVPARDGYTFAGWYADEDFTHLYDFAGKVQGDVNVYALWIRDGAELVNVTFDYDYYGVKLNQYSYPVEKGTAVAKPVNEPVRVGYTFDKWIAADGSDYDFSAPVDADITIKALWTKALTGSQTWVFEAEDTDLTGKIGPSYSGSAQEESMIIFNDTCEASNDRLVGYLYEKGISLEFYVACDEDVDNAQIVVRIAGEYITMSYDGNDYQVLVNGEAKSFPLVTIEADSKTPITTCADLIQISGVSLKKGANLIQLMTNNTKSVDGTTFKANAPMVDCVKVITDAVVIWDENFNVPAVKNYQK